MSVNKKQYQEVLYKFNGLLNALQGLKPNDRSEQDRYWAITITEVEKAKAVFGCYGIQGVKLTMEEKK